MARSALPSWRVTLRTATGEFCLDTITQLTVMETADGRTARLQARLTFHAPPEIAPACRDWLLLQRADLVYELMIDDVRYRADHHGSWYTVEGCYGITYV